MNDSNFVLAIIDDDNVSSGIINKILSLSDIQSNITIFQSGNMFIQELKKGYVPDLCLIGVGLESGLNGYNISRYLKTEYSEYGIAVIFITNYADEQSVSTAYDCGASDYIVKPFNKMELIMRVKNQLKLKSTLNELKSSNAKLIKLNKKYWKELELARSVHNKLMLNSDNNIQNNYFDLDYLFCPHFNLGGDYIDVIPLKNNLFAFIAGDIAGHGLSTSLKVALTKSFITTHIYSHNSPSQFLKLLNKHYIDFLKNIELFYQTMFIGFYNASTKELVYSSAGNPFPFFFDKSAGSIDFIKSFGLPIGLSYDAEYSDSLLKIDSGDKLIIYTDGLLDIIQNNGDIELVMESDIIKQFFYAENLIAQDIGYIKNMLFNYLIAFNENRTEFNDDISVLFIDFKS
ncbi:MAG TPA: fused response regulator/phosphatase [bacterium]|nr:fused response regulator/phosphatase [bacterium]HPN31145.1 fused response regulator/phosphatase [bacterium]